MTKHAPMLLVCPGCGVYGTIEAFANDADARAVAALLGELQPDVAAAAQRYLRLWSPAKHKLTFHKARGVLEELVPLIQAGEIRRHGRAWPAPAAAWIAAIDAMLGNQNLELPMKSHGYLLSILAGDANKLEARAEAVTEEKRRTGSRAAVAGEPQPLLQSARAMQVRNVVAMLAADATRMRVQFGQQYTEEDARSYLGTRWPADVVEEGIATWKRAATA